MRGGSRRVSWRTWKRRRCSWLAERTPEWINPDHLTVLGLLGQVMAGGFYALSHRNKYYLLAVIGCLAVNWLGDSLDGTLARVRNGSDRDTGSMWTTWSTALAQWR